MPDSNRPRLKVSRAGIVLIKSFESFRPRAVQRADGRWVIGYGHTASAREGLTVGEQDAELLLQYDLLPVAKALNEDVEAALNQHQFDALASFAVSVASTSSTPWPVSPCRSAWSAFWRPMCGRA
ncbi:MAG: hypothetical protein EON86_15550 [Brevundimonas sp.]|nr:MAG: hypothetical protein EON86_15550 [Brevundimonas sp.]